MKRFVKWFIYATIGITLVILAGVTWVLLVFDPNDYKAPLQAKVYEQTGRKLAIHGDIGLSFWPSLAVVVEKVELGNPQGFSKEVFASVGDVRADLSIIPLLSKRIEIGQVGLSHVVVNLEEREDGKNNWQFGATQADEKTSPPSTAATSSAGSSSESDTRLNSLKVGGVLVEDAVVRHIKPGAISELMVEQFTMSDIALDRWVDVSLVMNVKREAQSVRLVFDQQVKVNQNLSMLDLKDARLELRMESPSLPKPLTAIGRFDAHLGLAAKRAELNAFSVEAEGVRLQGEGDVSFGEGLTYAMSLDVPDFNAAEVLRRLQVVLPAMSDPGALQRVALKSHVSGSDTKVNLVLKSLRLDGTTMTGNMSVSRFSQPIVRAKLAGDSINIDHYLPVVTASKNEQAKAAPPAAASAAVLDQIPVEHIRTADVVAELVFKKVVAYGMRMEGVSADLTVQKGVANLKPGVASFYGGSYRGNMTYDVRGDVPVVSVQEAVKGVNVQPLLKDFMQEDRLLGTGNVTVAIQTQGKTLEEWQNRMDGKGSVQFLNGAVKGINIPYEIRRANAALKGQKIPDDQYQQTDFAALTGSFTINNGLLRNNDLEMKSPLLRVKGEGRVAIPKQTMDYRLAVGVVGTLEGQGGEDLEKLKGLTVPFRIKGPWSDLSYQVELEKLVEETQKKRAEERIEKEIEKKYGGDAVKGLKKLFGK